MDSCQASRLPGCAGTGEGSCAMSGGQVEHSRLAKTMAPRTLTHPRGGLEDLMGWLLTWDLRPRFGRSHGLAPNLGFASRISQHLDYTSDFARIKPFYPFLSVSCPERTAYRNRRAQRLMKSQSAMGE